MHTFCLLNLRRSVFGLRHKCLFINIRQISTSCKYIKIIPNIENTDIKLKLKDSKQLLQHVNTFWNIFVRQLCLLFPLAVDVPGFHICSFESEMRAKVICNQVSVGKYNYKILKVHYTSHCSLCCSSFSLPMDLSRPP